MKFVISVFFIAFVHVDAWVSLAASDLNTGDCYTTSYNLGAMAKGETRRIEGQCAEASCGQGRYINIMGCVSVEIEPPCRIAEGNLSKPYPACCYEIVCPETKLKMVNEGGLIPKDDVFNAEINGHGFRTEEEPADTHNKI